MLTWEDSNPKGQIWPVLQTIFNSALFRGNGAAQQKIKTPLEFTVSAIRALRASTNGGNLPGTFAADTDGYSISGTSANPSRPPPLPRMGNMLLFDRDSPDGYSEFGPAWISAGTLAERIRFVQSFCIASGQPGHSGTANSPTNDATGSTCSPVNLLLARQPATTWTNAPAVTDYFLGLLYSGEGGGNLQLYRQAAIAFLNDGSADSPPTTKTFNQLTVSGTAGSAYDTRVRGMVGMLMTMQRFHEQ